MDDILLFLFIINCHSGKLPVGLAIVNGNLVEVRTPYIDGIISSPLHLANFHPCIFAICGWKHGGKTYFGTIPVYPTKAPLNIPVSWHGQGPSRRPDPSTFVGIVSQVWKLN